MLRNKDGIWYYSGGYGVGVDPGCLAPSDMRQDLLHKAQELSPSGRASKSKTLENCGLVWDVRLCKTVCGFLPDLQPQQGTYTMPLPATGCMYMNLLELLLVTMNGNKYIPMLVNPFNGRNLTLF